MIKKRYVVGFLFNNNHEVALIKKTHPEWQKGKLNGVGGHIEENESPHKAMCREFHEEAGLYNEDWQVFCLLEYKEADIYFFKLFGDFKIISKTEEKVYWYPIDCLPMLPHRVIPNLNWLIPFAIYGDIEPEYKIKIYKH